MTNRRATAIKLDVMADLHKWRAFVAIAELGSLTRAALVLDRAQPVLSRQMNALERECDARLFVRTGRGVELSEFGRQLFPAIKALLVNAGELEREIRGGSRGPSGVVTLGLLPSLGNPLIGRLFKRMHELHPAIHLKILEGSSGQVEEWLGEERLDIAILYRYTPSVPEGEHSLAIVDSYLIGAKGDRLTSVAEVPFAKLDRLPLILPSAPNGLRNALDALARRAADHDCPGHRGRLAAALQVRHCRRAFVHRAAVAYGLVRNPGRPPSGRESREPALAA